MARDFELSNPDRLELVAAPVTGPPFSVSAWFKMEQLPSTAGSFFAVFIITDFDATELYVIDIQDVTDIVRFRIFSTGGHDAAGVNSLNAGQWYHVLAVAATTTDRKIWINGGDEGSNTDEDTPTGIDRTIIGASAFNSGYGDPFDGVIAEVGLWDVALTTGERDTLAAGYSPSFVRPASRVEYWPLVRDLNSRVSSNTMSATGTTVSPHPRIIYPSSQFINTVAAGAPPGTVPKGPLTHPLYGPFAGPIAC